MSETKRVPVTGGAGFVGSRLAEARLDCVLVEREDACPWKRRPGLRRQTAYGKATAGRFPGSHAAQLLRLVREPGARRAKAIGGRIERKDE